MTKLLQHQTINIGFHYSESDLGPQSASAACIAARNNSCLLSSCHGVRSGPPKRISSLHCCSEQLVSAVFLPSFD